jgi:peroxiredoxin Q/BCP
VVIGASTDTLALQQKFTDKENLNFPLLADPDKKLAQEFGVLNAKNGFASRATFVIDKKGIVRKIYPTAKAAENPKEVLDYVKENLKDK